MGMQCSSCGRSVPPNSSDPIYKMRKLQQDTRSGIKKALFDRKFHDSPGGFDHANYEYSFVCKNCKSTLQNTGWEFVQTFTD